MAENTLHGATFNRVVVDEITDDMTFEEIDAIRDAATNHYLEMPLYKDPISVYERLGGLTHHTSYVEFCRTARADLELNNNYPLDITPFENITVDGEMDLDRALCTECLAVVSGPMAARTKRIMHEFANGRDGA